MSTDAPDRDARQPNAAPDPVMPARVEGFALGPFETNCYVVYPEDAGHGGPCWFVDAGYDPEPMIDRVDELGLRPEAIVLTHAHADHIAGLDRIREAFPGVPVLIHEAERSWPGDPQRNLSAAFGMPVTAPGPDRLLHDGQELRLGSSVWRVLHTPGHSPGGIALYDARGGQAIVGDALFSGSVGRTDLPGGDPRVLAQSIRLRLYTLPDDTTAYPGHGPPTTIGREKRTNPFVRA
jgi:hydroxyacylglutathione hydrolase